MRINHNITAQLASVNLQKNDGRVSKSLEKLSSGYKITKAADDSAGLAISNKMRTQIRALDQASRNAQDGQSIVETADGALNEITSILQRVRELSVQAANDTNTLDDRSAAQAEIDQMLDEIDRISSTTEFNGKYLLDGSSSRSIISNDDKVKALSVSMSVTHGEYEFTIGSLAESAKATIKLEPLPATVTDPLTGKVTVPDKKTVLIGQEPLDIMPGETADQLRNKLVDICDRMNLNVEDKGSNNYEIKTNAPGLDQIITYREADSDEIKTEVGKDASITLGNGFKTTASAKADGNIVTIIDNGGFEMVVELNDGNTKAPIVMSVYDAGYMDMQIGANEHQSLSMDFQEISCNTLGLRTSSNIDTINVGSHESATRSITAVDQALSRVNDARAELGAYENRLESTSASLDVGSYNMTNSMSRIIDTDMAEEMTNYTQLTVLQQAATAMLSQANNRPKEIMNLLQGM